MGARSGKVDDTNSRVKSNPKIWEIAVVLHITGPLVHIWIVAGGKCKVHAEACWRAIYDALIG